MPDRKAKSQPDGKTQPDGQQGNGVRKNAQSTEESARVNGARSIWKGSVSFGLVNIPVQLFSAVQEKTVRFHLFSEKEKCRVREKLVCQGTDKTVARKDLVKGYPAGEGRNIIVTPEELEHIAPKSSRTFEILQFTDFKNIDPIYFNHSYYLLPEANARKAYALFVRALEDTGKAAVGKLTLHRREYLGTLRVVRHSLCLETMHFYDEVRQVENLPHAGNAEVRPNELETAKQLVDSLSGDFDVTRFHDEYRENVLKLIQEKEKGRKFIVTEEERKPEAAEVVDLMSTLEASLKKAKKEKERIA